MTVMHVTETQPYHALCCDVGTASVARAIFQPAAYCHTPFESISVWSCLMARRKRQFLEDDDSDSSPASEADEPNFDDHNDPDARAERRLFEDPYHHKRTRKNAKEDAIYGVFGSDEDEEMDDRFASMNVQ